MHGLTELKEMLCAELEQYGERGSLSSSDLEKVDKLAHAVKNIDRIMEGEYSERYPMTGGSYNGSSYARRRDSRGRYSSSDMAESLRSMADKMENMR